MKHFREVVINEQTILPGQMVEINIMEGKTPSVIQIIGISEGFAVRRPEARSGADILYTNGNPLTITNPDGTKTRIVASAPENWQAHPMLDPME